MSPDQRANRRQRLPIDVGDDVLEPRADFAKKLQVSDRTAARMNLPTTYIGNVAYIARNASLKIVAARVRRANPPRRETA
jgi:hypothetical protein